MTTFIVILLKLNKKKACILLSLVNKLYLVRLNTHVFDNSFLTPNSKVMVVLKFYQTSINVGVALNYITQTQGK